MKEKRWQISSIQSNPTAVSQSRFFISLLSAAVPFNSFESFTPLPPPPPPPSSHCNNLNICNPHSYKPAEMSIFIKKILNNFMRRSWARFHVRSHCFLFFFYSPFNWIYCNDCDCASHLSVFIHWNSTHTYNYCLSVFL